VTSIKKYKIIIIITQTGTWEYTQKFAEFLSHQENIQPGDFKLETENVLVLPTDDIINIT
jgi:hypothetical protein